MLNSADQAEKDRFRITTHKELSYKLMKEAGMLFIQTEWGLLFTKIAGMLT
jgi:hypothetical protein